MFIKHIIPDLFYYRYHYYYYQHITQWVMGGEERREKEKLKGRKEEKIGEE